MDGASMDQHAVHEIIACLPSERTIFSYFSGRYALVLLAHAAASPTTIRQLREGPYAQLLETPRAKAVLARCGSGQVEQGLFNWEWPAGTTHDFLLGLTDWGYPADRAYSQTSRRGYNLVLQLNLNTGDMERFARLVEFPNDYNFGSHPCCDTTARRYRETLAWSRLDVSFETDEVLVEEIQSDFVRYVHWKKHQHRDHDAVLEFCRPFQRVWQEAMLTATIQFIWDELGIANIFYHEFGTGNALKRLGKRQPPRSLYNALPRKFCMSEVQQVPEVLMRDRAVRRTLKKIPDPRFYRLTN